jgi:hypothetical protein
MKDRQAFPELFLEPDMARGAEPRATDAEQEDAPASDASRVVQTAS